jgi:outer membrane protein assembly factor BamB
MWPTFHYSPARTGFNRAEHTIGTGNVASLKLAFTAATGALIGYSSPAVVNGVVYIGSEDKKLYAFSATGKTGCSGTPKTCQPLWASTPAGDIIVSSPTVANSFVYVGSHDHHLYVFDAGGSTGCTGAPKVCEPVWTADVSPGGITGSPLVVDGIVYVSTGADGLFAFDAAGTTNCSGGTPRTCQPLWTATGGGGAIVSPSLWNHKLYVPASDHTIHVYDASGVANCDGTPKTCQPLWTTAPAGDSLSGAVSVSNGMVFVGSMDDHVYAFDARGQTRCAGTPKTCEPLWLARPDSAVMASSPAVANGVVYIGAEDGALHAYDAAGNVGCSGGPPKFCTDLWIGATNGLIVSSPAVANGVVYVGSFDHQLHAYDAAGNLGCSDTPKTCQPLWSFTTGGTVGSSPAIADGMLYVGSTDGNLYAFSL